MIENFRYTCSWWTLPFLQGKIFTWQLVHLVVSLSSMRSHFPTTQSGASRIFNRSDFADNEVLFSYLSVTFLFHSHYGFYRISQRGHDSCQQPLFHSHRGFYGIYQRVHNGWCSTAYWKIALLNRNRSATSCSQFFYLQIDMWMNNDFLSKFFCIIQQLLFLLHRLPNCQKRYFCFCLRIFRNMNVC